MAPAFLVSSTGCAPPTYDLGEERRVDVGAIEFHYSTALEGTLCPDSAADRLDRAARAQATFLGLELPTIEYHLVAPEFWPDTPCLESQGDLFLPGTGPEGCTLDDGRVWALNIEPHELVHAIEVSHRGHFSVPFLTEGVAAALDEPTLRNPPPRLESLTPYLEVETYGSYDVAGGFVSFLLLEYGAAVFDALQEPLRQSSKAAAVEEAFRAAYGADLIDLVAAYDAREWELPGNRLAVPWCFDDELAEEELLDVAAFTDDCGAAVRRNLVLEQAGYVRIHTEQHVPRNKTTGYQIGWCPVGDGATEAKENVLVLSYGAAASFDSVMYLAAGRYYVGATTGNDSLTWSRDVVGSDCTDPMTLGPGDRVAFAPPPGRRDALFVRSPESAYVNLEIADGAADLRAWLCSDACLLGLCTEVATRVGLTDQLYAAFRLEAGVTYALMVEAATLGGQVTLQLD